MQKMKVMHTSQNMRIIEETSLKPSQTIEMLKISTLNTSYKNLLYD
jgi:hypothetical protein